MMGIRPPMYPCEIRPMQLSKIAPPQDCRHFFPKKKCCFPFFSKKWKNHLFLRETPRLEFQGGIKRASETFQSHLLKS